MDPIEIWLGSRRPAPYGGASVSVALPSDGRLDIGLIWNLWG